MHISTAIDLEDLTDDNVLDILLTNEKVAEQFRKACFSRQQKYQEDLENIYRQRLSELEDYTRKWRDTTKELWRALESGRLPVITQQQQEALDWQAPRQTLPNSQNLLPPYAPSLEQADLNHQENAECAEDRRSSAAPTTLQGSTPSHQSLRPTLPTQLSCVEWIQDISGYMKNGPSGEYADDCDRLIRRVISGSLGLDFPLSSLPGEVLDTSVLVRVPDAQTKTVYRRLASIDETKTQVHPGEVVVDLNSTNIALLGKAFCYISDRIDLLQVLRRPPSSSASTIDVKKCRLYDMFSSRAGPKMLSSRGTRPQSLEPMVSYRLGKEPQRELRKLIIVRPKHTRGIINGVRRFDVGLEQEVPDQGQGGYPFTPNLQVFD